MTATNLYQSYVKTLQPLYGPGESEAISRIVFEDLAGIKRSDLILLRDTPLDAVTEKRLLDALEQLQQHIPVQQVTGKAWFFGMSFTVTGDVLIPRPETEELTERAIRFLSGLNHPSVLDIGTGSGCIAVSIKKKQPGASVTAVDVSGKALNIAVGNARNLAADIRFIEMNITDEQVWDSLGQFDCIISNPPYIPVSEKSSMDPHVVQYEPHLALFVENDRPLIFYEKIAGFGKSHLAPGGLILVETHEGLAQEVCKLFRQEGYEPEIIKDMFGKERMVSATLNR